VLALFKRGSFATGLDAAAPCCFLTLVESCPSRSAASVVLWRFWGRGFVAVVAGPSRSLVDLGSIFWAAKSSPSPANFPPLNVLLFVHGNKSLQQILFGCSVQYYLGCK